MPQTPRTHDTLAQDFVLLRKRVVQVVCVKNEKAEILNVDQKQRFEYHVLDDCDCSFFNCVAFKDRCTDVRLVLRGLNVAVNTVSEP